jgi:cell division protein FtsB
MKKRILQAYRQAPWRVQLQWIGLFMLGLILTASIAGVYLSISAQAAAAGRQIQFLEEDVDVINNEISELTADLASARSTEKMLARAKELGFSMMNPAQAIYLEIPGFDPTEDLVLAPPRVTPVNDKPALRSSYKASLWDLFVRQFWNISDGSNGIERDANQ